MRDVIRLFSDEAIEIIVTAATTRPQKLDQPFSRWSLRKLAAYLADAPRPVAIGRELLRQSTATELIVGHARELADCAPGCFVNPGWAYLAGPLTRPGRV